MGKYHENIPRLSESIAKSLNGAMFLTHTVVKSKLSVFVMKLGQF